MKRFFCDCCEKPADTHETNRSPEGWGRVNFSVRQKYDITVNIKGDLCPDCLHMFKASGTNWLKVLRDAVKGKKK